MNELRIVARCVLMLAGALACAGALAQAVPSDQAASAADRAQKQADRTLYWIRVLAEKPAAKPPAAAAAAKPPAAPAPTAAATSRAVAAATEARPAAQKVASVLAPQPSEAAQPAAATPAVPMPGTTARGTDPGAASPAVAAGMNAPALVAPDLDVPQQVASEEPDPGLVMVKSADPQFPMATMRRLRKGEVEVRFEVGPDGQVDVVSVVRSTNPGLNNAALEAVRQWQFKPTPRGHTAVVDLAFDLDS